MSAPAPDQSVAPPAAYVVAALYQFREVLAPEALQAELRAACEGWELCGTLIVAPEGLNGTVAGPRAGIDALHALLIKRGFEHLEYKESLCSAPPFQRLKIKLKAEIVTLGQHVSPLERVGRYVEPRQWNTLMADPEVLLIDTRNEYEYQAGSFEGAVNPQTYSFRDFPAWAEQHLAGEQRRKVALFCTGGIRCEKATSYLLARGFEDVYHLKGGILAYLEQVSPDQSRYHGECFVFDERVTVAHGLHATHTQMCACRWPLMGGKCAQCQAQPEQEAPFL